MSNASLVNAFGTKTVDDRVMYLLSKVLTMQQMPLMMILKM